MASPKGSHIDRRRILHISADFPDPIAPHKTPVIDRLIELVDDHYDHHVLSLNRRSPGLAQIPALLSGALPCVPSESLRPFGRGHSLEYLAPPRGLLHATMLDRLAAWIVQRLTAQQALPALVVGHKLTVEGLLARKVANRLGIPYAITVQGNTDQKILSLRPDLAGRFADVFHEAACVFCFAPWARRFVEQRLGTRKGMTLDLPCPTVNDEIRAPCAKGTAVISVFHLRNHKIKNLTGLAAAVKRLADTDVPFETQIFGGGSPDETAQCTSIIRKAPGMSLMGSRTPEQLAPVMNGAIAFVMPSRRETFGLVFIEALFAGLPIIYPRNASVDGYFDGLPFAMGVDARRPQTIAQAISHAIRHEAELKAALAQWQQAGGLEPFSRKAIADTFAQGLDAALGVAPIRALPARTNTPLASQSW